MKKWFVLALVAASANVFANPAGQFVGRYTIEQSQSCRFGVDADRAYIKLETNFDGRLMLEIKTYGLESRMDSFPVESSVTESVNSAGDTITDRTRVTWPSPTTMRVSTVTEAPSMNIRYTVSYKLMLKGNRLSISETHDGSGGFDSDCILIKKRD